MESLGNCRFSVLSDYEAGRSVSAIEAVGRGSKPVAEIGNVQLEKNEIQSLIEDIRLCLSLVGELNVKGFLLSQGNGRWSYGFFREAWVERPYFSLTMRSYPHFTVIGFLAFSSVITQMQSNNFLTVG
jgi:hypothetical protein